MELQEFIHSGITAEETSKVINIDPFEIAHSTASTLQLKNKIQTLELESMEKDKIIEELQNEVEVKGKELYQLRYMENYNLTKPKSNSKGILITVLLIIFGFGGFTAYNSFIKPVKAVQKDSSLQVSQKTNNLVDSLVAPDKKPVRKIKPKLKKNSSPLNDGNKKSSAASPKQIETNSNVHLKEYKVINMAFLYRQPDEKTKSNFYISPKAEPVTAVKENEAFVCVEYVNSVGDTTQGWLLKKDLSKVYNY